MIKTIIGLSLSLILFVSSAQAQDSGAIKVSGVNFDSNYFSSNQKGKYGVIVLTGSDGGKADYTAGRIAAMGFHVLSLAYFDKNDSELVPNVLKMIKLEYFEEPKNWLMGLEGTKNDGVILYGLSKGAELALVLASLDSDYKGIVALAPSHVVWAAPRDPSPTPSSSWSIQGKGLPFLPYIPSNKKEELGISNWHEASLTNESGVRNALIKVENIRHPVLLLSGEKDNAWPSTRMGEIICSKANKANPSSCKHVSYQNGDHLLTKHQDESFGEVEIFLNSLSN